MARHQITRLRDDLDPTKTADQEVFWSWGGEDYVIDLTNKHAQEFAAAVEKYRQASSPDLGEREDSPVRVRLRAQKPRRLRGGVDQAKQRNRDVRAWCAGRGIRVSPRGAVPNELLECYRLFLAGRQFEVPEKYRPVPQQRGTAPATNGDVYAAESPAAAPQFSSGLPKVDPAEAQAARGRRGASVTRRARQVAPV